MNVKDDRASQSGAAHYIRVTAWAERRTEIPMATVGGQPLGQSRCGNFAYQAGLLEISIDNTFHGDECGSPILLQSVNWERLRREGAPCLFTAERIEKWELDQCR